MSVVDDLGYARGSADKLARRPFDMMVPKTVPAKAKASYLKAYKRGFDETVLDTTGASFGIEFGTSPAPGTEGNADQGFNPATPVPEPAPSLLNVRPILNLIKPKAAIPVAQRQAASPFATPTPTQEVPPPNAINQTLPGIQQMQVAPQTPPTALSTQVAPEGFLDKAKAWLDDNWQYVALGVGAVVVVGGTVMVVNHMNKSAETAPKA